MKQIETQTLKKLGGGEKDRLVLYPIQDSDTDNIIRWRNQDFIQSCFVFRSELTKEMHSDWLKNRVAKGEVIQYIIENIDGNMPIGSIYIRDIDIHNECGEFGIYIGEQKFQKQGLCSEAIRLFMPYIFSLGFHRVFLRVFAGNESARKCYLKAGFLEEGTAHDMVFIDGKRYDIVFMAMIAEA